MNYDTAEVQNIIRLAYESAIARVPQPEEITTLNRVAKDAFIPLKEFYMSIHKAELKREGEVELEVELEGEVARLKDQLNKTKESGVKLQEMLDKTLNDNQEISHNWQNCLEGNKNLKEYADKKEAQLDSLLKILVGVTDGNNNFI